MACLLSCICPIDCVARLNIPVSQLCLLWRSLLYTILHMPCLFIIGISWMWNILSIRIMPLALMLAICITSPLCSNILLRTLRTFMMFTCFQLNGTLLLFQFLHTGLLAIGSYDWFTACGHRALFFTLMVWENNMAGVQSFKLNLTCFQFILTSILIAASKVLYYVSAQTTKPVT